MAHNVSLAPPQSVEHDHPNALEFLRRDAANITDYFGKQGVRTLPVRQLFDFIVDPAIGDSDGSEDSYLERLKKAMDAREAAMEAVLALGDAGAAAAARAEEEVEAAVFQRAFIPKSLSEVSEKDLARDASRLKAADPACYYGPVTGMVSSLALVEGAFSRDDAITQEEEELIDNDADVPDIQDAPGYYGDIPVIDYAEEDGDDDAFDNHHTLAFRFPISNGVTTKDGGRGSRKTDLSQLDGEDAGLLAACGSTKVPCESNTSQRPDACASGTSSALKGETNASMSSSRVSRRKAPAVSPGSKSCTPAAGCDDQSMDTGLLRARALGGNARLRRACKFGRPPSRVGEISLVEDGQKAVNGGELDGDDRESDRDGSSEEGESAGEGQKEDGDLDDRQRRAFSDDEESENEGNQLRPKDPTLARMEGLSKAEWKKLVKAEKAERRKDKIPKHAKKRATKSKPSAST